MEAKHLLSDAVDGCLEDTILFALGIITPWRPSDASLSCIRLTEISE